jgi:hypothetical protein
MKRIGGGATRQCDRAPTTNLELDQHLVELVLGERAGVVGVDHVEELLRQLELLPDLRVLAQLETV